MKTKKKALPQISTAKKLTESALLIALASVLGIYAVYKLPNGGSVTVGSMIPIMLVSLKYPFRWSATVAFAYSLIQMISGFYAPPVETMGYYLLMVLLDYVVAFGVLCLVGPFYRSFSHNLPIRLRLTAAAVLCFILRFLCHFLSGVIIWGAYAPPDQPVWLYSLVYNGSFMLGEGLISGLILLAAGEKLVKLFLDNEVGRTG